VKNRLHLVIAVLAISGLSGCAFARLYPVQGPLAAQTPLPVATAKISGAFESGSISVKLPTGEVCKGHWQTVHSGLSSSGMASVWDTVYGQGFYQAHVLGSVQYAQAIATSAQGTTLTIEMYEPVHTQDRLVIKGVAKDNKGNLYKMTFGAPA
jgi:hypothetical protein